MNSSDDTKERLLDAAERLFATSGIAATSLRAVTVEANANVAAVHYHFGSKLELLRRVFARRVGPVNEERLKRLEELEGSDEPPTVEALLEALVRPVLEFASRHPEISDLVGLLQAEPAEEIRPLFEEVFGDTISRFTAALGRALPHLDKETLDARYVFVSGAVISAVECRGPTVLEPAAAIPDLVRFLAAGMRAAVDSSEVPLSPARQTP